MTWNRAKALGGLLLAVVAVVALPELLTGYMLYVATLIVVYAFAAMGLNIIMGFGPDVSLGHAGFFALGAYGTAVLMTYNVPFIWAVLLTVAGVMVVGVVVGLPALRLRELYLAIATLAFGLAVERVIYFVPELTRGPSGLPVPPADVFGLALSGEVVQFRATAVVFICLTIVYRQFMLGRLGYLLKALQEDEIGARAMGVNVARTKLLSFALSSGFTAVGGAFYAILLGFIGVEHFAFLLSIYFVAMVVIGGAGSIYGPILGALLVSGAPEVFRRLENLEAVAFGVTIVAVLLFLPDGLVGLRHRFNSVRQRLAGGGQGGAVTPVVER
jgi:branched-chain amino acid transport system permease protein